jgi:hypothetical protein
LVIVVGKLKEEGRWTFYRYLRALVIGYWLLVIGYWLLVIGYWLLVIGYWLLVIGSSPNN